MVVLIFCGDLKYCPYLRRYIERLDKWKVNYHILFWNRGGLELNLPDNYMFYGKPSDLSKRAINKNIDFWYFRKWVLKKLEEISPEKIIILSTLSGIILGSKLYKSKIPYIFDIRDYSYEHLYPFYVQERKIIENSTFTAISSKGFKEFLPQHDYVIAHNFNRNDIKDGARFVRRGNPIKFVWNGTLRFFEYQRQYLDALKNDKRFQIVFHGDGPQLNIFKSYCSENGFKNAIFTGSYNNTDKADLLKDAGILNNCYGYIKNPGNKLKYAVSNRFYDGLVYRIPQLIEPEGYKSCWAESIGVGKSLTVDEGFANKLYEYYMDIDETKFNKACATAIDGIICEDDEYISKIDAFIK